MSYWRAVVGNRQTQNLKPRPRRRGRPVSVSVRRGRVIAVCMSWLAPALLPISIGLPALGAPPTAAHAQTPAESTPEQKAQTKLAQARLARGRAEALASNEDFAAAMAGRANICNMPTTPWLEPGRVRRRARSRTPKPWPKRLSRSWKPIEPRPKRFLPRLSDSEIRRRHPLRRRHLHLLRFRWMSRSRRRLPMDRAAHPTARIRRHRLPGSAFRPEMELQSKEKGPRPRKRLHLHLLRPRHRPVTNRALALSERPRRSYGANTAK